MRVRAEATNNGHGRHGFRLTLPDGRRFQVRGDAWTRAVAGEARRVLAVETGRNRAAFRFDHH